MGIVLQTVNSPHCQRPQRTYTFRVQNIHSARKSQVSYLVTWLFKGPNWLALTRFLLDSVRPRPQNMTGAVPRRAILALRLTGTSVSIAVDTPLTIKALLRAPCSFRIARQPAVSSEPLERDDDQSVAKRCSTGLLFGVAEVKRPPGELSRAPLQRFLGSEHLASDLVEIRGQFGEIFPPHRLIPDFGAIVDSNQHHFPRQAG